MTTETTETIDEPRKQMTSFRLSHAARKALWALAKQDLRSMTGEIEYLILQETQRRKDRIQ
jgi:hypothetical protein